MNKEERITRLKEYLERIKQQMPTANKQLYEFFERELKRTERALEELSK